MNRYERAWDYADHLWREGYTVNVAPSSDLWFHSGTRRYRLSLTDEDGGYIDLRRTFWRASTDEEEQHARKAARIVTETVPPAEVYVKDGNVLVIVGVTLPSHKTFFDASWRYIETIDKAVEEFVRIMREILPKPPVVPYPITLHDRAETYRNYLASRGFRAWIDPGETVAFTHEGREYVLLLDDTHENEIILTHRGALAKVKDAKELARAMEVAKNVTDIHPRVAILATPTGEVHASVHVYLADPMTIDERFDDCFYELATAVERFHAQMAGTK